MQIAGSTILVTGGGSGIGRGLAEGFYRRGAQVIVAGRRRAALEAVVRACPGVAAVELDVTDPEAVARVAGQIVERHPALNVLVNNAGVMRTDQLTADPVDLADAEQMIATNLLGPIRLTSALLPHLRRQPHSMVINVSSALAFVPMASVATYCATKAALHSWSQSLRWQLKGQTEVIEIAPPYVQTTIGGERQATDPNAMPLDAYIAQTFALLEQEPTPKEVLDERARFLRQSAGSDETFAALNRTPVF